MRMWARSRPFAHLGRFHSRTQGSPISLVQRGNPVTKQREDATFVDIDAIMRERESEHICGNCRSWGGLRSALPCKNDPARRAT